MRLLKLVDFVMSSMHVLAPVSGLIPVFGLLLVAAITPGPNNFLVLNAGLNLGPVGALKVMAGIIIGSLGLFAALLWGVFSGVQNIPHLIAAVGLLGALYLAWMAIGFFRQDTQNSQLAQDENLPSSFFGVAVFQVVNPKAWVLLGTIAASIQEQISWTFMFGFIVILAVCLSLWGFMGASLSKWIGTPQRNKIFSIGMGSLLLLSAAEIFLTQLTTIIRG